MSDVLPEWQDFRDRRPGESEAAYVAKRQEFSERQFRNRDHWLVSQQGAILGNQELLRDSLAALPDKVIAAVEAKRRNDRRKFLRDVFVFAIGIASILGSIAAMVAVVK